MEGFNIQQAAKGLISHAVEQQNGWERPLQEGHLPWPEQRRLWVDAVLQGMARLKGQEPDPSLMKQYEDAMKHGFPPSTVRRRRATNQNFRNFVSAMEETGNDHRRQVDVIGDLLEDISLDFSWGDQKKPSPGCHSRRRTDTAAHDCTAANSIHPHCSGRRCWTTLGIWLCFRKCDGC